MSHTAPTFLVAGAAKAGTTSVSYYLRQHPDVFMAREKESHHFLFHPTAPRFTGPSDDREMNRLVIPDRNRYLACFAGANGERAIGESSVYYLYRPESLESALRFNPGMRFVVILREPLARAYSAYSHHRRDGWETLASFGDAVAAEDERVEAGWSYGWHYRRVSDYENQLRAAIGIVPPSQLRFVLYEDLVAEPVRTMQNLFHFLGVDDSFVCDTSLRLNMSGKPRSERLNLLLGQSNVAKDMLKKLVPYRLGVHVQQQVRNWNLRPEKLDHASRVEVADAFRYDRGAISKMIGCSEEHLAASW